MSQKQNLVTTSVIQGHPSTIRGPEKSPESQSISAIFSVKRMQKVTRTRSLISPTDSRRKLMSVNTSMAPCRRIPILKGIKLSPQPADNLTSYVAIFAAHIKRSVIGDGKTHCHWLQDYKNIVCDNSTTKNMADPRIAFPGTRVKENFPGFHCDIRLPSVIHNSGLEQSDIRVLMPTIADVQIRYQYSATNTRYQHKGILETKADTYIDITMDMTDTSQMRILSMNLISIQHSSMDQIGHFSIVFLYFFATSIALFAALSIVDLFYSSLREPDRLLQVSALCEFSGCFGVLMT